MLPSHISRAHTAPLHLSGRNGLLGSPVFSGRMNSLVQIPGPRTSLPFSTRRFSKGLNHLQSALLSPGATPAALDPSLSSRNWAGLLQKGEPGRATWKLGQQNTWTHDWAGTTLQLSSALWLGTGLGAAYKFDGTRSRLKFYFTKQNKLKMH